jgi:hypothetical protein
MDTNKEKQRLHTQRYSVPITSIEPLHKVNKHQAEELHRRFGEHFGVLTPIERQRRMYSRLHEGMEQFWREVEP